ncbi:MAG: hypothetical protein GQ582_01080 [Methyloprofundus sp.]|nr:hypothetical protein [Methyloprofundus sp.]
MDKTTSYITHKDVQNAFTEMEVQAVNFGSRLIKDSNTRAMYMAQTKSMSNELAAAYKSGVLTPKQAAEAAHKMRNEIMELARVKSSDTGKAKARALKAKGLDLNALTERYAQQVFKKPFVQLTDVQKNQIYRGIVDSAGRANPKISAKASSLGKIGKGLWLLTACVAIYNVSVADNKIKTAGREVTNVAGGFAGGAATGAVTAIWLGPIGVAVGVIVGGTLGAIMADQVYVEVAGVDGDFARVFIPRFTNMASTDEDGMAKALLAECSYELDKVYAIFIQLNDKYSTDADDIALIYVNLIKSNASAHVKDAFGAHHALREYLVMILDDGWTSAEELSCIQYLRCFS